MEQSVHSSEQGAARQPAGGLSLWLVGFELVSTFWGIACFLEKESTCSYSLSNHARQKLQTLQPTSEKISNRS